MTNKYSLENIRKSSNEFEAFLRIYGISNLRLCKIIEVNYATSRKFIENPTQMRFSHTKKLADFIGLDIQDIIDTIVYDIK